MHFKTRLAKHWLLTFFVLCAFVSCVNKSDSPSIRTAPAKTAKQPDFHPTTLQYAKRFSVTYESGIKKVHVSAQYANHEETYTYWLIPAGSSLPSVPASVKLISVPLKNLATTSTTYLSHMSQLGVLDALVGVQNSAIINNEAVQRRIKQGHTRAFGHGETLNLEKLLDLSPDAVMTFGVGDADVDQYPALIQAGLPVVMNAEWMESTPLARAEWVKFMALFFNKEKEAEEIFNTILKSYVSLQKLGQAQADKPTVLLNADFQGTWYVPDGQSYMAQFMKDAGGRYLWADRPGTSSRPVNTEVVVNRALKAKFWLHPGQSETRDDLLAIDSRYRLFEATSTCHLYNYTNRTNQAGGNDFWETGVTQPHKILADLLFIFHPSKLPDHQLVYYKQLPCNENEGNKP